MTIESRMPRAEYDQIQAMSITRLKGLRRSPLHYQYLLTNPKVTQPLTLGIGAHTAVLEPERFLNDFAIWDRKTESGRAAPRNGKWWDAFQLEHQGRTILTDEEARVSQAIAAAVRFDPVANKYLASGDPEVTMRWELEEGRPAKGRIDWLTVIEGKPTIVGLKTTRDCRHFAFGSQAAKLDYAIQWAWYCDGYKKITGREPQMVEIVVESEAPHAVATYFIRDDILLQGRDNYRELLKILAECEAKDEWPGPQLCEEILTLPTWYYQDPNDDIDGLGLVALA